MEKLINAIKYPFTDKDWQKKLGYLALAYLVVGFITGLLSLFLQVPLEFASGYLKEANSSMSDLLSLASSFSSLLSSLLTLPLTIFVLGYLLDYTKGILTDSKDVLPQLNQIGERLKVGFKIFILTLLIQLPGIITSIAVMLLGVLLPVAMAIDLKISWVIAIVIALTAFVLMVFVTVINFAAMIASGYIYITSGRLSKALNIKSIFHVIRYNEKPILNILLYFVLANFMAAIASGFTIFLLCLAFFTGPLLQLALMFVKAHILGTEFKNFKKLEE